MRKKLFLLISSFLIVTSAFSMESDLSNARLDKTETIEKYLERFRKSTKEGLNSSGRTSSPTVYKKIILGGYKLNDLNIFDEKACIQTKKIVSYGNFDRKIFCKDQKDQNIKMQYSDTENLGSRTLHHIIPYKQIQFLFDQMVEQYYKNKDILKQELVRIKILLLANLALDSDILGYLNGKGEEDLVVSSSDVIAWLPKNLFLGPEKTEGDPKNSIDMRFQYYPNVNMKFKQYVEKLSLSLSNNTGEVITDKFEADLFYNNFLRGGIDPKHVLNVLSTIVDEEIKRDFIKNLVEIVKTLEQMVSPLILTNFKQNATLEEFVTRLTEAINNGINFAEAKYIPLVSKEDKNLYTEDLNNKNYEASRYNYFTQVYKDISNNTKSSVWGQNQK